MFIYFQLAILFCDLNHFKLVISILGESLSNSDNWEKRQELCHLYETLLLIDLDYALDKKVEQDLWSFIFRNPISACQSKAREHKVFACFISSILYILYIKKIIFMEVKI